MKFPTATGSVVKADAKKTKHFIRALISQKIS